MNSQPPQSQHWSSEHLRKKAVRIPLLIILYTICAFFLFLFVKGLLGYPIKVFGIEVNQRPKADTIKEAYPIVRHDTFFVSPNKDSISKHPISITQSSSNKKKPIVVVKDTSAKQTTSVEGDNTHVISGNNNQVGVNGNVNINSEKQLTPTDKINLYKVHQ